MTQNEWLKSKGFELGKNNTWSRGAIALRKGAPAAWYARTDDVYADATTPRLALLALADLAESQSAVYRTKSAALGNLAAELRGML